ncbi:hypothetical protein BpHYR1_047245 [Brachionus plicatilis]|uniref:Uncharacterized protein n=1 Tax=Brachionus plicatilis TaxID=10195 RepID=A0A3M7Q3K1_BRAPC|nr:hypothetical protein BpHYR1_047245 [Brachionus plicatilis]
MCSKTNLIWILMMTNGKKFLYTFFGFIQILYDLAVYIDWNEWKLNCLNMKLHEKRIEVLNMGLIRIIKSSFIKWMIRSFSFWIGTIFYLH